VFCVIPVECSVPSGGIYIPANGTYVPSYGIYIPAFGTEKLSLAIYCFICCLFLDILPKNEKKFGKYCGVKTFFIFVCENLFLRI